MLVDRNPPPLAAAAARPAVCLDCPDCRGTCWEVLALRLVPDCVLRARAGRR